MNGQLKQFQPCFLCRYKLPTEKLCPTCQNNFDAIRQRDMLLEGSRLLQSLQTQLEGLDP